MDLFQIIQMLQKGQNPQQLVMSILQQKANNNPMFSNLLNLAQNNKTDEIEQIVRNYAKEQGIDYDAAFNAFKQQLMGLNK